MYACVFVYVCVYVYVYEFVCICVHVYLFNFYSLSLTLSLCMCVWCTCMYACVCVGLLLLQRGADVLQEDAEGVCALQLTMEYGIVWLVEAFQSGAGEKDLLRGDSTGVSGASVGGGGWSNPRLKIQFGLRSIKQGTKEKKKKKKKNREKSKNDGGIEKNIGRQDMVQLGQ